MDTVPTENSSNYVTSGGVATALKDVKALLNTEVLTLNSSIDTKLNKTDLPKYLSDFSNDKTNYITVNDIPEYYVTEKMLDDRKYLTSIPLNYVTTEELASRNYLTTHQDISGKANKSELSLVATTGSWNDLKDKPQLLNGEKGDKGDRGEKGDNGASAYQVAVTNGFVGDESA
jgi:hypothetical protein